jgi:sporulation protein YlmC with PRC-barrel domain
MPALRRPVMAEIIDIVVVDLKDVRRGYRLSTFLGSYVYNDDDEEVGTLEDLVVDRNQRDRIAFAILEVGGFLGLGAKRVAIEYDALQLGEEGDVVRIALPGATKKNLQKLPEYKKNG